MIIAAFVCGFEEFIQQKSVRISPCELMELRSAAGKFPVDHTMQKICGCKPVDDSHEWIDLKWIFAFRLMKGKFDDICIGEQFTINKEIQAFFEVFFRLIKRERDEQLDQGRECRISNCTRGFIFPSVIAITSHIRLLLILQPEKRISVSIVGGNNGEWIKLWLDAIVDGKK